MTLFCFATEPWIQVLTTFPSTTQIPLCELSQATAAFVKAHKMWLLTEDGMKAIDLKTTVAVTPPDSTINKRFEDANVLVSSLAKFTTSEK